MQPFLPRARDNGGMAERTDLLRVALAQINATVGDIPGNAAKIAERIARARDEGAALVVFPELALTGYPPEDLLLKTTSWTRADAALEELAAQTQGIAARGGLSRSGPRTSTTAAAVLADGDVVATYRKMHLPNYGVFDEQRYFQAGTEPAMVELNGMPIGLTVCEDIWEPGPPACTEALAGAQVIVNLSASPYHAGKGAGRERMLDAARAGQPRRGGVLQHRGRPGRARLRRPQRRDRPGRPRAGPRAAVRGGADALHDRPGRRGRRAAARHAPPGRTCAGASARRCRAAGVRWRASDRAQPTRARSAATWRTARAPRRRSTPRSHRAARLRREERLRARRDRPLGRDRLGARGAARRATRSARSASSACRCPPPTRRRARERTPARSPRTSASSSCELVDRGRHARLRASCSREAVRGHASRTSPRRTSRRASAATS